MQKEITKEMEELCPNIINRFRSGKGTFIYDYNEKAWKSGLAIVLMQNYSFFNMNSGFTVYNVPKSEKNTIKRIK